MSGDVVIIYVSVHHGNTEKIAKAISSILGARLVKPWEIQPDEVVEYKLAGFGSGIYYWRHHTALIRLAEKLPPAPGKMAFIFSTAGIPLKMINHRALKKILVGKRYRLIGDFTCRGWDTNGVLARIGGLNKGHPNEKDLEKAVKFALRLKRILEEKNN
ncbi:flavodoxin family protein [Desulfurococcus amylolyticus]|uniref:flavodoxin family protein n=1 Tax=Desulfurococcus amylolyticus TaxID=94694 RepID=UPI0023F0F839|nr:flavodoxin family protein [Desulfurococcus amylolyticus]